MANEPFGGDTNFYTSGGGRIMDTPAPTSRPGEWLTPEEKAMSGLSDPTGERNIMWASGGTRGATTRPAVSTRPASTWRADLAADTARLNRGGGSVTKPAMQWMPQSLSSTTTTGTRTIGDLPDLPEYQELDEDKVRSRTQEFSALGRREAKSNFQSLLSRLYGANPDDPYAKDLARKASAGFSMDTQRAISAGGREALSAGLSEQQVRNNRQMTAYQTAVNSVLATGTTTSTQTREYAPTPMQAMPTNILPTSSQQALSTRNTQNSLSLGQPYTYG